MNRSIIFTVVGFTTFFFILYFGCDVRTHEKNQPQAVRDKVPDSVDFDNLIAVATAKLNDTLRLRIQNLTQSAKASPQPTTLKLLSSTWHDAGNDEIAAHYAESVADTEKTDAAWSVAGGNFYLAAQKNNAEPELHKYCLQHAADAFQNAASIKPDKWEYRLNMALCYTENPPQDNPMKGILLLRDLDKEHPENVSININLARLAIKTGQFDKAVARLEKILPQNAGDKKIICLLADAYTGKNDPKAAVYAKKCRERN
jgi:thioredoxin-like negative regulator of GroEL